MRVFVAGATGALGAQLVPRLVAAGHEVTGMTRSAAKADAVRALGARPAIADALDADAVARVVAEAEPQVVVHQLTALSGGLDLRHFDRSFATTNRLRSAGTDHLLAAARAVGAERFIAQSYAGWPGARSPGLLTGEEGLPDEAPVAAMRESHAALRHLEQAVTEADWTTGIVLRYGSFYGPGTSMAPGGEHLDAIRARKFPVVGDGGGVWSFIHVADAADATVLAIEHGRAGIYNVVDDDPAPVAEWLPALAARLGAKRPLRVPRLVGRIAAGPAATVMMTEVRGASNAKARQELGWQPAHPSWRDGLLAEAA